MSTAVIQPACVPETFVSGKRKTAFWPVQNPATTNLPAGNFCVLSSGLLAPATLTSDNIASGNILVALTAEPYRAALSAAESVPVRQTGVGVHLLMPETVVEVNFFDTVNNPNHRITQSLVGTTIAVHVSGGVSYGRFLASYSGLATFIVVDLVDAPGTIHGRILIKPVAANRLF